MTADIDDADRAALDLSIKLVLDGPVIDASVVRAYLKEGDWWEAASQASYNRQMDHLELDPWESPPCWIDEDEIDDIIARGPGIDCKNYNGALLLRKMIAAGIAKYHPQPITALASAKTKRKRSRK